MKENRIVLLGIPFDAKSSYRRGAAEAPSLIRKALFSPSSNLHSEDGALIDRALVEDLGDVPMADEKDPFGRIEMRIDEILRGGSRPICLGGDHAITYPVLKAFAKYHPNLTIFQIDAHPDLYDVFDGDRFSHACPFARIMEEGLAIRLIQVGIRTLTAHQAEQAKRFAVEIHDMRSWTDDFEMDVSGPLYVSLDIDALDPAFAPGVSHREPGGFSTRQVIRMIQALRAPVVGADIVEFNPRRDVPGMTDMVCAKLLKEIAAKMQ